MIGIDWQLVICRGHGWLLKKWVLVVTKLFNMVVNDFDAKQSAHYSRVFVVTELVLSGTQCT